MYFRVIRCIFEAESLTETTVENFLLEGESRVQGLVPGASSVSSPPWAAHDCNTSSLKPDLLWRRRGILGFFIDFPSALIIPEESISFITITPVFKRVSFKKNNVHLAPAPAAFIGYYHELEFKIKYNRKCNLRSGYGVRHSGENFPWKALTLGVAETNVILGIWR